MISSQESQLYPSSRGMSWTLIWTMGLDKRTHMQMVTPTQNALDTKQSTLLGEPGSQVETLGQGPTQTKETVSRKSTHI